jgi:histone-arginine methyltransferase CARM1
MLADYVRTGTYQRAMYANGVDFNGKVVLDVGTGSGILAFFALQAGAARVYAVDASDAAKIAEKLAHANGYGDRMKVIKGKIEEITLPEKVDIIISEPIGFLLVHERMLESYVVARDRFLVPGGLMMPTTGSIVLCPFTDDAIFKEQMDKVAFWTTTDFYGIDLSAVREEAVAEYFAQPIVGYVDPNSLISHQRTVHTIDFSAVTVEELQNFDISFRFEIAKTSIMHGFCGWFDISFLGTAETVVLSTSPDCPGTHWYQCRLLFPEPLAVNKGQFVSGVMHFEVNEHFRYTYKLYNIYILTYIHTHTYTHIHYHTIAHINLHILTYIYIHTHIHTHMHFSYYIHMTAHIEGTDIVTKNKIHLKDQV